MGSKVFERGLYITPGIPTPNPEKAVGPWAPNPQIDEEQT